MQTYTVQILIPVDDYEAACELMNKVCVEVNKLVDTDEVAYSAYVLDEAGDPVY